MVVQLNCNTLPLSYSGSVKIIRQARWSRLLFSYGQQNRLVEKTNNKIKIRKQRVVKKVDVVCWLAVCVFIYICIPFIENTPKLLLLALYIFVWFFFRLLFIVIFSLSPDLIPSPNFSLPHWLSLAFYQESTFSSRAWKLRFFCKILPNALST